MITIPTCLASVGRTERTDTEQEGRAQPGQPAYHERRQRFFSEHGSEAAALYRRLGTISAVCDHFPQAPVALVQEAVHRFVGDLRPDRAGRGVEEKVDRNAEIVRIAREGELSYRAIGRLYGISGTTVSKIVRRLGGPAVQK